MISNVSRYLIKSYNNQHLNIRGSDKYKIFFQSIRGLNSNLLDSPGHIKGIDHLRDARLNKGLAFTLEERQRLGIHGLMPPRFKTQEEQISLCKLSISRYQENLNKYLYLVELQDRNERLFFRLLSENIEQLMPIVYTPTVGLACQKFGLIYTKPRGIFITIHDRGHIAEMIRNWPESDVRAVVVTDGERILGLGDLGACGMGIPVGKLALYTALAGIPPHQCLPITLDVGTNNKTLLEDPLYIGLRQPRVTGPEYDELVDEFMQAVVQRYGQNTLIQFEDFANHNAFRLLDKYRNKYCTFNDDIQGTASVIVAGILAAVKQTKQKLSDNKFLFFGAGEAALGIAYLTMQAIMKYEKLSQEEASQRIWMFDIDGLLAKGRPEGNLDGHKGLFAKDHPPTKDFKQLIAKIKPSMLIGASAVTGAFSPEIIEMMASFNERPVIMALSNPTSKAECTAEQAIVHSKGRALFASGSPFPPINYEGKSYKTGQGNNAYVFPGIAMGCIISGMHHISEDIFLIAAQTVADMVEENDFHKGSIYPALSKIKKCSLEIATNIMVHAYKEDIATMYPEPKDKRKVILQNTYDYHYKPSVPEVYHWSTSSW